MPTILPPKPIPIVILAGQSNANSTQLTVEAFKQVAARDAMLVHVAMNGSSLSADLNTGSGTWNAPTATTAMGSNLAALCAQLWSILNPASPSYVPGAYLQSMIWIQGEADAWNAQAAANYGDHLRALHTEMTARFGSHQLVISALSDQPDNYRDFYGSYEVNWNVVRDQQRDLAAALPTVHLVNPDAIAAQAGMTGDDMFRWDYIHYDDVTGFAGMLGRALASTALGAGSASARAASAAPQTIHAGTGGDDVFRVALGPFKQVLGGAGHDSVSLLSSSRGVSLIEATAASARIVEGTGAARKIIDLLGIEDVTLTSGHDRIQLAGGVTTVHAGPGWDRATGFAKAETYYMGRGGDMVFGAAGNDTIWGEEGNDTLWGAMDDDLIYGGSGNDLLYGDAGSDVIFGGTGNDVLTGGDGADRFVFGGASGRDRIVDFDPAADMLQFSGVTQGRVAWRAQGADLLVTAGATKILLVGVTTAEFGWQDISLL
jgi:Ca2+-binding RTX toxin-like protein